MKVGAALPARVRDAAVLDLDGGACVLGERLVGPSVLLALRHFGCIGCDQQVTALKPHLAMLGDLGFAIVMVGLGEPRHARGFADRHQLEERRVTLLRDPSLALYAALGLARSGWSVYGPRGAVGWLRAWGRGFRQEGFYGDTRQQGGAFVIDGAERVRFIHRSARIGDDVDVGALVGAALSSRSREESAR